MAVTNAPKRCIAVVNQKGGSAKTTTVVGLAEAFALRGVRVLVLDADAQAAATRWLGCVPQPDAPGLLDALTGDVALDELCVPTSLPNVQCLPASAALVAAERTLAREVGAEGLLAGRLRTLTAPPDVVLCDTAPTLGLLALNCLVAATDALIPVECRGPALAGLVPQLDTITAVRTRLNPRLRLAGILPVRLDGRAPHTADVLAAIQTRYGRQVCRTAIRENVALSVAATAGVPPARHAPGSPGARGYAALAAELIRKG